MTTSRAHVPPGRRICFSSLIDRVVRLLQYGTDHPIDVVQLKGDPMRKYAIMIAVLAIASTPSLLASPAAGQDKPNVVRKVLSQQDAPGGNTLSMFEVTIPVGGREGRHSHPGPLLVHVVSGELTIYYEGQQDKIYKVGDTFYAEPNHIHEGRNDGTVPVVGIAAIVTPKGAALTKQVSQ
jgi:quercetin dioxygenase-like cupin family protein